MVAQERVVCAAVRLLLGAVVFGASLWGCESEGPADAVPPAAIIDFNVVEQFDSEESQPADTSNPWLFGRISADGKWLWLLKGWNLALYSVDAGRVSGGGTSR